MDLDLPIGSPHTLGQDINSRRRAVQLPPAVIAHNHAVAAVLPRQRDVLGGQHALDPDLHRGAAPQPRDLGPRVRGRVRGREVAVVRLRADRGRRALEDGEGQARGRAEVAPVLVAAHAQHGAVGRQQHGRAAGGLGAPDDALLLRAVVHGVELDAVRDARPDGGAGAADVLERVVGVRRDAHVDAAFGAGAGGGELAVRMRHGLEAGGRDAEGEGDLLPEDGGAGVDVRHIAEDSGAQAVFGVGRGVFVDRDLVCGSRVEEL